MKEKINHENKDNIERYLDEEYGYKGEGKPPPKIANNCLIYLDKDGKFKWVLRPEYINPKNEVALKEAKEILEEMKIWPLG